jgi:hypothetical protein
MRGGEALSERTVFRLLYVSGVSTSVLSLDRAMTDILVASASNNRRDSITGFLVCDGFQFAQALEGPQDKVERCFTRICDDRRNVAPSIVDLSVARGRAFGRWSMCGLTLSQKDDELLQPPEVGSRLAAASAGALWQHLISLALRHGPELDRVHEHILALAGEGLRGA